MASNTGWMETDSFCRGTNIMAAGACAVGLELCMNRSSCCWGQAVNWRTVCCAVMAVLAVDIRSGLACGNGINH